MEEEVFIPICWPDIQYFMDKPGFKENCHLINDESGIDQYGSSAYFCSKQWLKENDSI